MSTSPAISNARLPHTQTSRSVKRPRPNLTGKPLSVSRLLETLDTESLRSVLRTLSDRHVELKEEIVHLSPRPSIANTLQVLREYQNRLRSAFPLGPNPGSDYSYDRVRQHLANLLDALSDFTPHFLPPNEPQSSTSLSYLDGITQIIHELPQWDSAQHNMAKENAYEEISRAWVCVIREASKRGGGIQLRYGQWDEKLQRHNEISGGRLQEAVQELSSSLGWIAPEQQAHQSIRQQLFSGTYGAEMSSIRSGFR